MYAASFSYSRRWCVVEDSMLRYYKSDLDHSKGKAVRGGVDLRSVTLVRSSTAPKAPQFAFDLVAEVAPPASSMVYTVVPVPADRATQMRWMVRPHEFAHSFTRSLVHSFVLISIPFVALLSCMVYLSSGFCRFALQSSMTVSHNAWHNAWQHAWQHAWQRPAIDDVATRHCPSRATHRHHARKSCG